MFTRVAYADLNSRQSALFRIESGALQRATKSELVNTVPPASRPHPLWIGTVCSKLNINYPYLLCLIRREEFYAKISSSQDEAGMMKAPRRWA